jgi:hypothetical protein
MGSVSAQVLLLLARNRCHKKYQPGKPGTESGTLLQLAWTTAAQQVK